MATISEVFQRHFFEIPAFQRMFAWENKEIEYLFNDISRITNHPGYRHHLGYITLLDLATEIETKSSHVKRSLVIDGQQRITALMLLVASYIHRTKEIEALEVVREELGKAIFINIIGIGESPRLKIQDIPIQLPFYVNMPDFFNELLTTGNFNINFQSVIPAQRKLLNAISIFHEKLRNITSEDDLLKFGETLLNRVEINENINQNYNEAGNIFEGLNNRGKQLSELEKLKSYFIFCFQGAEHDENQQWFEFVNIKFAEIYHHLEVADIANDKIECDLINAHFSAIKNKIITFNNAQDRLPPIRKIRTSDDIRAYINIDVAFNNGTTDGLRQAIEYYLNTLSECTEFYADIRRPLRNNSYRCFSGSNKINPIRNLSHDFVKLESSITIAPLLISFCIKFKDSINFDDYYLHLLKLCERGIFRVIFVHEKKFPNNFFYGFAQNIEENNGSIDSVTRYICSQIADIFYNVNNDYDFTALGFKSTLGTDPNNRVDHRTYYPYLIYKWLSDRHHNVAFDNIKNKIEGKKYLTIIPPSGALNGNVIPTPFRCLSAPTRTHWHRDFSNIFIAGANLDNYNFNGFNGLNFDGNQGKRGEMLMFGVIENIPDNWTLIWSQTRRAQMTSWAFNRWAIPQNGWI